MDESESHEQSKKYRYLLKDFESSPNTETLQALADACRKFQECFSDCLTSQTLVKQILQHLERRFLSINEHQLREKFDASRKIVNYYVDYDTFLTFFKWITTKLEDSKCCFQESFHCGKKSCLKSSLYRHIYNLYHTSPGVRAQTVIYFGDNNAGSINQECVICYSDEHIHTKLQIRGDCRHKCCFECFIFWAETTIENGKQM